MAVTTARAAAATRKKLRRLEEILADVRMDQGGNPAVRDLELRSLTSLANQLREELAVFEARSAARASSR